MEGEKCTTIQTVAGFILKGPGQQQLFLSQRNVGTTGASFVLEAEPCEGHLEVSLRLKRVRDPRAPASVSPKGGEVPRAPQGWLGMKVRPPPPPPATPRPDPSSSPDELEKHLVFCIHSVNIYLGQALC